VVGKLVRVWAWFDSHTQDGNAISVTYPLLDRIAGVAGFAEAMAMCGWLEQSGSVLRIPNFGRHNGETAKKRALTNERVAKSRELQRKGNAECNDASVTHSVTESVTREEKRREEKKEPQRADAPAPVDAFDARRWLADAGVSPDLARDFLKLRKDKRAPVTETAAKGIEREAAKAGLSIEAAVRMCCERNWQGFKADWLQQPGQVVHIARNGVPHSSEPTRKRQML